MQDLVDALRMLDYSQLPEDYNALLTAPGSPIETMEGGRVLLDRIDELAHDNLLFAEGKLAGKPDFYNHELLKDQGYTVTQYGHDQFGRFVGVIHTRKGKIVFE